MWKRPIAQGLLKSFKEGSQNNIASNEKTKFWSRNKKCYHDGVVDAKLVNRAQPTICLQFPTNTNTPPPNKGQPLNNHCSTSVAQPNPQCGPMTNNQRWTYTILGEPIDSAHKKYFQFHVIILLEIKQYVQIPSSQLGGMIMIYVITIG